MTAGTNFERWLLLATDAVGYGKGDDQRQARFQTGLVTVLDAAAAAAGLHRDQWIKDPTGDGELALIPPSEPEPRVVDDFVREVAAALAVHNRDLVPQARLRLRMAIHYGTAMRGDNGWVGQGVVTVSRLVDSPPIREALSAPEGASLAVMISRRVFEDVVRQGHVSLTEEDFRAVTVELKEFSDQAWLRVLGRGAPGRSGPAPRAGSRPSPAAPVVIQHFHDRVIAGDGPTFGIRFEATGDDHG